MFKETVSGETFTLKEIVVFAGNTFIGLKTKTTPKLVGGVTKNPMFGLVDKFTVSNGQCFTNENQNGYANKKRKENPDFVLSQRTWGVRVPNTPFVEHKGTDYLEVILKSISSVDYTLDGVTIAKSDIQGLPVKEKRAVEIVTYKFDSILEIRTNGKEYKRV